MWPFGPVTHYNISSYTGQVTHYNVTIWAGNPLQYTITKKNPCIFQSLGRSPRTIRPLAKFFAFLLSLGRLPKTIWSISKKNPRIFQSLDRSLGTIRALTKFFAFLLSLVRLPKTIWSIFFLKRIVSQMTYFLISTSLCKGHVSIYCFQN